MSLLKKLEIRQSLLSALLTDVARESGRLVGFARTNLANPVTYKRMVAVVVFVALAKLSFFNGDICLLFAPCFRIFCT